METQQNWLEIEEQNIKKEAKTFDKKPTPEFKEGSITYLAIDFSEPFESWTDDKGKIKALIPCESIVKGNLTKCIWWLNKKNPIYSEIIHIGREQYLGGNQLIGIKIFQIGTGDKTQYKIIKE